MLDLHTDCRYTLCTLTGKSIVRVDHDDDLAGFLPLINLGGPFALVDRAPEAVGDELPFLEGRVVAMFTQPVPVQAVTGRAPGNGRSANGRFRTNFATTAIGSPLDLAGLEAVVARCQATTSANRDGR